MQGRRCPGLVRLAHSAIIVRRLLPVMALIPLKCPNCAGDIQIDDTKEFAFCMFCGTKMVVQEQLSKRIVVDDSAKISGLLKNAKHFFDQKAYADAHLFASKICELKDDVAEAWYYMALTSMDPVEKRSCLLKARMNADADLEARIDAESNTILLYSPVVFNMKNPLMPGHIVVDGKDMPNSSVVVVIPKGQHTITSVPNQGRFSESFTQDFSLNMSTKSGIMGTKVVTEKGPFPSTVAPFGVTLVRLV